MEKIKQFYKDVLPIYLLFSYCLGYVFISTYYSRFGIDIEYYISITDLLFLSIYLLLNFSIVLLIIEIILSMIISIVYPINYEKLEKEDKKKLYQKRGNAEMISFLILMILSFVVSYLTGQFLYVFSICFTLLPIKIMSASNKFDKAREEETNDIYNDFVIIMVGIVLFIISFLYGFKESSNVKNGNGLLFFKKMEFQLENDFISTNDSIYYVGESSEYLFLYLKKIEKTGIYKKADLKNFRVIDPTIVTKKDSLEFDRKIKKFIKIIEPKDSIK